MRSKAFGANIGDHYVALLSNGTNPQVSKRHRKTGSKVAKLAAIAIALFTIGAFVLFFAAHTPNSSTLKASVVKLRSSHDIAVASSGAILSNLQIAEAFEDFIAQHGKYYASLEEKTRRLKIFTQNFLFIHLHNAQNFTYTLAANAMADLTFDEFRELHLTGYRPRENGRLGAHQDDTIDWSLLEVDPDSLPESINWKEKGCVTEVKDQRKCGACWAFSASGSLEGAYCVKYGQLKSLSEQQMVDCAGPEGNGGCNGGEMDDAFQYIIDRGGLCTEESYPYTAHEDKCRDKDCTPVASVTKFADVPRKNEKALKAAIVSKGPVSVAIQADQLPFQFYHHGVFDASCGKNLNHGVLVVGYGTDAESGKDYWLVKNSWGTKWGDQGYIKLLRSNVSRSGECGVLMEPSYPVVQ